MPQTRRYFTHSLYEIALVNDQTGERLLVCYAARKTRAGLADAVRNRWDRIERITGVAGWHYAKRAEDGVYEGPWRIRFTGRTEIEAKRSGELPWIGDLAAAGGKA